MTKTNDRHKLLYEIIAEYKPRIILEIGVFNGKNARKMIRALRNVGVKNIEYYGFDVFEPLNETKIKKELSKKFPASYEESYHNLKVTGVKFKLFKGESKDTLKTMEDKIVDFIFIDGGHSPETIKNDWCECQRFISKKTLIIFDDYYYDRLDYGCQSLINGLDKDKWRIKILEPMDNYLQRDGWIQHTQMVSVKLRNQ